MYFCPLTKSEIPPGVFKSCVWIGIQEFGIDQVPRWFWDMSTWYMFETTELEKLIFHKLRDILPGNWPILLKKQCKKSQRLDACSSYGEYGVMTTKCNMWSGLDPESERKKKEPKNKTNPKALLNIIETIWKIWRLFRDIQLAKYVINCIKLDTRRYLFIKLTMLMPRI